MRGPEQRRGFTLIEMLTVIAIITLLAGILLPALWAARNGARKAQCKTEVDQIKTAWTAYLEEYRRFPFGAADSQQITEMNQPAIDILRAANTPQAVQKNPKRVKFMDFRDVTTYFCDPWGKHNTTSGVYQVALDADGDNKLTVGSEELQISVAVWSSGPDREMFTADDIVSWRR